MPPHDLQQQEQQQDTDALDVPSGENNNSCTQSSSSSSSSTSQLQQWLMERGVSAHDIELEQEQDDNAISYTDEKERGAVVEIKTLVWQVTVASPTFHKDPFYIVSALRMDDKVDIKLLKALIRQSHPLLLEAGEDGTISLCLAPQSIAEELTGFSSGCMPPIGHSQQNLTLFMDASIVQSQQSDNSKKPVSASIGSGIPGHSLLLPREAFLRVARNNSEGQLRVGSFVQSEFMDDSLQSLPVISDNPHKVRQQRKQERMGRQPKPKDRLGAYRRFTNLTDRAKLFKSTARKKGGYEDMKALVKEAISQGDFKHLLQTHAKEGLDKNAIHMSAWRGDLETVQLLLETAQQQQQHHDNDEILKDAVNIISKGPGNYGKTALFYALTQCREDVVRYLLSQGANLLFVNNKGQTPCSIAVSHMKDDLCQELFAREAQELQQGKQFADYRKSHSDHLFYGDLDPRFPIDHANFGGDLEQPLREFQQSVQAADPDTIIEGIATVFSPRSLRPTVRWWNRPGNDASLESANNGENNDAVVTFTQPRSTSRFRKGSRGNTEKAAPSSLTREELPVIKNIDELDKLVMKDVLNSSAGSSVILVNCSKSIKLLNDEVDTTIAILSESTETDTTTISSDAHFANVSWGLDCEWKPGHDHGKDNPVATLQLSTRRKSYLVDLQSLCQPTHSVDRPSKVPLTQVEQELNATLMKVFSHAGMPLLGFGIMQDLGKLFGSFSHLTCFSNYTSVVDLQSVSSILYPKSRQPMLSSLQKMTAALLSRRLDKTEQCSDWTDRPLSSSQIDYAVLDAAVLPLLLETMVGKSAMIQRYNGQFFKVHGNIQTHVRFTSLDDLVEEHQESQTGALLENNGELLWNVPMGGIRQTLTRPVARQCWPCTQATPALPSRYAFDPDRVTNKERAHLAKVGPKGTKKPKPIQLKTLAGNLDNLPIPGITLGYTKDSCVFRVVGHEFMNTLPQDTHVGFNRRSGVVETTNAWIIFCNFGASIVKNLHLEGQDSEFHEAGRYLSFQVNPERQNGKSSEKTLMDYIIDDKRKKSLLLFARDGISPRYIYCGSCRCNDYQPQNGGAVNLLLELLDYELLAGREKVSPYFVDLVQRRQDMYDSMRNQNEEL